VVLAFKRLEHKQSVGAEIEFDVRLWLVACGFEVTKERACGIEDLE
jgi:hypothetical protein